MPRTQRLIILDRPEEYRWNSIGYHIQTGNKDNFLSLDFGLKEFGPGGIRSAVKGVFHRASVLDNEESLKGYRRYLYVAGALDRSGKPSAGVIDNSILGKEQKNNFELKRVRRFRYRTRYFTDSGIIGTKEFVSMNYHRFKNIYIRNERRYPRLSPAWMGFIL